MTDPQEEDFPSLGDELFGTGTGTGYGGGTNGAGGGRVRAEPIIKTPKAPPWERFGGVERRDLVRAGAGFATFVFVDLVMMYAPLMGRTDTSVLPQFVALLVVAFGLGGMCVWHIRGSWRPYGFGLMLGWVFLTLISAGFLTGVLR
ncbi:hypothetical protein [Thermomonospora umbrina]|uniref:Uncharacterized protein n=1 Tax=Thermomonospora umbrina TaxID=111806 RepID=A0A3D9SNK1_9ACTN|nr:hypothetical protein [Thermomonospora umbrina]REE97458.1 hypothetical protein DFJ69_2930 [Thermomonospora umbrina]